MQGMLNVITFSEILKIACGAFFTGAMFGAAGLGISLWWYETKQENKK